MDESRYDEWLSLWTDDAQYWVPCNEDDIDPERHVSIIYDDRDRLVQRVERLKSGSVLAQQPRPRMRRLISNIEVVAQSGNAMTVHSNFMLGIARTGTKQLWTGRSIHDLVIPSEAERSRGTFKIARKKVLLIESDQEIPLLQFLI
jgi:3-phenylpropionate/cinnamic acid dioxygenase small subunit